MRIECIYPFIEPEDCFNLLADIRSKLNNDDRFQNGEILEDRGDSFIAYWKTPKPPIPMVSAREFLQDIYKVKDGMGEGRHFGGSMSVEHPSKPVTKDNVRAIAHLAG